MYDITPTMLSALKEIDAWGGDLGPDFEELIGCRGACMDAVIGGLIRRAYLTSGAWGTYIITPSGYAAIKEN